MWASAVGDSGAMPRDWEQKVPPIDLVGVDRGWGAGEWDGVLRGGGSGCRGEVRARRDRKSVV